MVDADRIAHVRGLEAHLRARIRGQDHVLPRLSALFARGALGLASPDRPRGSVLLVGPTGTGKSESFALASSYLLGPDRLVSFDLSEYQDKSAVSKLLGVDRTDRGLLGQKLLSLPPSAILFDEIEKAHPLVFDLFLQILWHGRITLATGETVRFHDHTLGFTSNLGAEDAIRMSSSRLTTIEQATLRRVTRTLRPELLGRIQEKLVFARLTPSVQREICELEVARETERLKGLGYDLAVTKEAMEFILREGFDHELGARPLRQTVGRQFQDATVRSLIEFGVGSGQLAFDHANRRLSLTPGHASAPRSTGL